MLLAVAADESFGCLLYDPVNNLLIGLNDRALIGRRRYPEEEVDVRVVVVDRIGPRMADDAVLRVMLLTGALILLEAFNPPALFPILPLATPPPPEGAVVTNLPRDIKPGVDPALLLRRRSCDNSLLLAGVAILPRTSRNLGLLDALLLPM